MAEKLKDDPIDIEAVGHMLNYPDGHKGWDR